MEDDKTKEKKIILPVFLMGCLFILINGLSLIITNTFEEAGMQAFENPDDPTNIIIIVAILLVMTLLIIMLARFFKKQIIQYIILGAIGYTAAYVFIPLFALIFSDTISIVLSIICAIVLIVILYKYPEWYVIDISGIIVGTGAIAIFGISLGVLVVIILLLILAVYDAISVYKTKHMIDLADTVMDLRLPVLLVIPKTLPYSLINETKSLKEKIDEGEKRDAFFMGLGDIVMPGMLVIAVYRSITNGLPLALSALIGTLIGFSILMIFVIKGKPQAGLPFLCGGAIAGYVIGSLILYQELVGLTLSW
jgi:presenilin-like A22 family membrane protease